MTKLINFSCEAQVIDNDYHYYASAMKRNSDYILSEESFLCHIENYCSEIRHENKSVLYGEIIGEHFFKVSHWSPSSLRNGIQFLKDLQDYQEYIVIFGVLEGKMTDMMNRLYFHYICQHEVLYPISQMKNFFCNCDIETFIRELDYFVTTSEEINEELQQLNINYNSMTNFKPNKYEKLAIECGYNY